MTDERAIGERVASQATQEVTCFWLAEMLKIEEQAVDNNTRWDLLKRAMAQVVKGLTS